MCTPYAWMTRETACRRGNAEGFFFKRQDLAGEGTIAGMAVRCLTPQSQVECHAGYELPDVQRSDLELLRKKFLVEYPLSPNHQTK